MKDQIKLLKALDTDGLFQQYGSPIYIYDETKIRKNFQQMNQAMSKYFKKFMIHYAVKANSNPAIVNILRQEGANADCSTPSEIHLAKVGGMKNAQILYSGNYQNERELIFGLKNADMINLDSDSLLEPLLKLGTPKILSLRINPNITKGEFKGIETAGPDAKFGIDKETAIKAFKEAQEKGVKRFGIHMMTGSGVRDANFFQQSTHKFFADILEIHQATGIQFEFIDIGGGFGVPYQEDQHELDIDLVFKHIKQNWDNAKFDKLFNNPVLLVEPGKYLVANSGMIITQVDCIKTTFGRTYLGTGCGMNTIMRPALYDAKHTIIVKDKEEAQSEENYQIVGKVCENTDFIAHDYSLPKVQKGDTLAILTTGAYGFAMASQYNSFPRCAEVLIKDGQDYLIRKPEKAKDLHLNVIIPKHLKS